MNDKPRVLITGSSGVIGGVAVQRMSDKYAFSALNRRPVDGIPCIQADISDFDSILPAFENVEMVLHLAAKVTGNEWEGIRDINLTGTYNVYEASRQSGVKRIVFASTGGTMTGYTNDAPYSDLQAGNYDSVPETWPMVDYTWPVRPSSLYSASKVFGESLGRYYSDTFGISVINIRIGRVLDTDRPKERKDYAGFLSHADCA